MPAPTQPPYRVSVGAAAVVLFAAALAASWLPYAVVHYLGFLGRQIAVSATLAAVGVALGFMLSSRFHLHGRRYAVVGVLFVATGALMDAFAVWWGWDSTFEGNFDLPFFLTGLGAGLALPAGFWRIVPEVSPGGKVLLAASAASGLIGGFLLTEAVGFQGVYNLRVAFAPLICLPAVLFSPVVRKP